MASATPKVFISHATEDKERFVLQFAESLRANGVDAWLDKWEMHPGDSSVDKIFEEGIKEASALIVVLSHASIASPWVREELNAAFVKRISGKCRIIPVVLDACEVPECLKSTLWQRIDDLNSYAEEFQRILNSIFRLADKPPIGASPAHAELSPLLNLQSLHKIDNLVLEALCEESVRANDTLVTNLQCLDTVADAGATDDEIRDSLTILHDGHYIELSRVIGRTYRNTHISHIRIRDHSFDAFARAKWSEYDGILGRLIAGLVNEGWRSKADVDKLGAPERLRDHLIRSLEDSRLIKVSRHFGGYSIWDVSPRLRRVLEDG